MANPYFSHSNQFLPNTLARGDVVDSRFTALVTSFDTVDTNVKRAIKVPVSITDDMVLPTASVDRANKYIGFDATGDVLTMTSPTGITSPGIGSGDAFKILQVNAGETAAEWVNTLGAALGVVGLSFPVIQVPSADANTLDDYEEGTFTPTLFDAASGGNEADGYTYQEGTYTKIGNVVYIYISIKASGTTAMTGANDLFIRDLPFTCRTTAGAAPTPITLSEWGVSGGTGKIGGIISGTSSMHLFKLESGGAAFAEITVTEYNDGHLSLSGSYTV